MAYTDYSWVADRLAIGGFVHEPEDDLPFDAILSMETHAPAVLRELVLSGQVDYQWRSILDGDSAEENDEIVRRFDEAADQLHAWLRDGKRILVHCFAGISRSVTAVVWYLVRYEGRSWDEALELIKYGRTVANPNIRFEIPLRLASGETLTMDWLEARIKAYAEHQRAVGFDSDEADIWSTLERQGTLSRDVVAAR